MPEVLRQACDACRSRKTRCKMSTADTCEYCLSRNISCVFGQVQKRQKRNQYQSNFPEKSFRSPTHEDTSIPYIDSLLADRQASRIPRNVNNLDQLTAILGPNPKISFFPGRRVRSISERLGHDKLDQLLADIHEIVSSKDVHHVFRRKSLDEYILVYFEMVHPLYPFISPTSFQQQAKSPDLLHVLETNKSFAALYYAVVAIGCQYNDGGSYEAGIGEAWSYFEQALSYFQDLIFYRGSLTAVQALMAMSIFSSTASAFQFEPLMLTEAAVMAQSLGYNWSNSTSENAQRRTFWVLYFMEKVSCFTTGKVSVLQDLNISCTIPDIQESTFDDYDWFFAFLRFARLVSKTQSSLFIRTSVNQSASEYISRVESLLVELESWRLSAPERFRPWEPLKPRLLREPLAQSVALILHYFYLQARLTLSWTLLQFIGNDSGSMQQRIDLKHGLMRTARSVLELTKFTSVAPSTPIWMLAVLPMSCLMILFDLVIHNPDHPETRLNLSMLDIASGHFSQLECASNGALPGSLLVQFAHIARDYIFSTRESKNRTTNMAAPEASSSSCNVESEAPTGEANPVLSIPRQHLPTDSATSIWNPDFTGDDHLFIPLIDDPSYHRIDDLELLGIDLKDLFDFPAAIPERGAFQ